MDNRTADNRTADNRTADNRTADNRLVDNRPIGIFDSGQGGLMAVNAMKTILPGENIIYAGDTARVPYGGKSAAELLEYAGQIIEFLQEKNVKAVIVACGTISSNIMDTLWEQFELPLIDVVRPAAAACLEQNYGKVGVIATEGTIKSGMFRALLSEKFEVQEKACPLFVPLIESGLAENELTYIIAENYLRGWQNLDALVLGCTHYPLLKPTLTRLFGDISMLDIAEAAVRRLKKFVTENKMLSDAENGTVEVFVSGSAENFAKMYSKIIGTDVAVNSFRW